MLTAVVLSPSEKSPNLNLGRYQSSLAAVPIINSWLLLTFTCVKLLNAATFWPQPTYMNFDVFP